MAVVGRLVDAYGPRPLFLAGTTLVGLAGVVGALSPQLWVLVLARVLLGFGTCAGYPAAMYLIRSESRRTGLASPAGILTVLSVSTQTISVIGPTLGGLAIGLGGWRAAVAVNVPLAVVAVTLGARRLPRTPRTGPAPRIDLAGIALFAAHARRAAPVPQGAGALVAPPGDGRGRYRVHPVGAADRRPVPRPAGLRRQRPAARDVRAHAAQLRRPPTRSSTATPSGWRRGAGCRRR
ncbi:MFS transporter [Pseudonocardia sp. NPDC049154]|uniref:MFS transporter n=1 Tax=Pseudonocardia sp. NPDC049154 TaxID=3155501 RepID=UPI0033E46557